MIRTLMTLCCVLMIGLMLTPETAEAKRFGGGSSLGKMFSTPKKAPQSAPKAAQSGTSKSAAGATAKPGMGGMIGGLLAGGLLGAMFFGGAFDGIQMMDVLMMALVAFVLFKLFARSKAVQRPQYAGHPASDSESALEPGPEQVARQACAESPVSSGSWGRASGEIELELPDWFDKKAFIEGAQGHFGQLQQAWNANDLEQIRDYCSAELFAALVEQRKSLGDTVLDNDLVSVVAELVGFNEQQGEAQLSIQFNGWMREGAGAEATEFNEVWHLSRDLSAAGADWFVVGIEQAG